MQRLILSLILLTVMLTAPLAAFADCQVTLQWDPNTGSIAGYRLYMRTSNGSYNYAWPEWQGATTQCTVTQLDENDVYYFVVRAFDDNDNESGNSNEVRFAYNTSTQLEDGSGSDSADSSGGCFIRSLMAPQWPFKN